MQRKYRHTLVAAAALVSGALSATSALAIDAPAPTGPWDGRPPAAPDLQRDVNVPYLAWVGEHVRLMKCDANVPAGTVTSVLEDWSGPNLTARPEPLGRGQVIPGPSGIRPDIEREASAVRCVKQTWTSLKPGLATIKVSVRDRTGRVVYHQFLVAWMTLNKPQVKELAQTDPSGAPDLGDPSGDGILNAWDTMSWYRDCGSTRELRPAGSIDPGTCPENIWGFSKLSEKEHDYQGRSENAGKDVTKPGHTQWGDGRIRVTVKGSFPMVQNWQGMFPNDRLTLPDDWALMASKIARRSGETDASAWDIHDDNTVAEGHKAGIGLPQSCFQLPNETATPVVDSVDNCASQQGPAGPFSTIFGLTGPLVFGPFDPVAGNSAVLLSDGKLDWGDAPMPPARVDVQIAPNSGVAGDISGAGRLVRTTKAKVYADAARGRYTDLTGNVIDTGKHAFYAPYYGAFIPATTRGTYSSGTEGGIPNNFPGYLTKDRGYVFWDLLNPKTRPGANTDCNLFVSPVDLRQRARRPKPYGYQTVSVYSDEHGEAQVGFRPGLGFHFDQIQGVLKNANGGCDLQLIKDGVLGSAKISATARYPFQPPLYVEDPISDPIIKVIKSKFDKSVTYYPKGPGAENDNVRIAVVHAQDIDGRPFYNERVCVSTQGGNVISAPRGITIQTPSGPLTVNHLAFGDFGRADSNACAYLDEYGNAAFEVLSSLKNEVDFLAHFLDEGLFRDIHINFAQAPVAPVPGVVDPGSTSGSAPTSVNALPQMQDLAGLGAAIDLGLNPRADATGRIALPANAKVETARRRVTATRVVNPKKRDVRMRVLSSLKRVRINLAIRPTRGKDVRPYFLVRTIPTNRVVTIKLPPFAELQTFSVLG